MKTVITDLIASYRLINKNKFLSILSVLIISSYNAPFLFLEDLSRLDIKNIFVIYQHIIPIVIFFIFLIFFNLRKIINNFFLKKEFMLINLFLITFILQLYGIFFGGLEFFYPINEKTSQVHSSIQINYEVIFVRFIYVVSPINLFILLSILYTKDILKLFLLLLFFALFIVFFYYSFFLLKDLITQHSTIYFYESRVLALGTDLFSFIPQPRATGLSRTALILSIFLILYFFIKVKTKSLFLFTIIFYINFFIFHFQTRYGVYCFAILNIFFIFYSWNSILKSLKNRMLIILLFFLPLLFSKSLSSIKTHFLQEKFCKENVKICEKNNSSIKALINERYSANPRITNIQKHGLSNRETLWKKVLETRDSIPFAGYGVLGDRFAYSFSVSNLFIYSYISGGVINLITILCFFSLLAIKIFFFIDKKKIYFKHNLLFPFSLLVILAFVLRSFVENSIGQFSIDLMVFLPALYYIQKYIIISKKT